jgi:hypothetical protein
MLYFELIYYTEYYIYTLILFVGKCKNYIKFLSITYLDKLLINARQGFIL